MNSKNEQLNQEDEILDLFFEESQEHLENIEEDLLSIEKAGEKVDDETIDRVFRAMHTIKGGAGFFGLTKVKDLTHVTENMLDLIRKKQMVPTKEVVQSLFSSIDLLNEMFNNPAEIESFDVKNTVVTINRTVAESIVSEDTSNVPTIVRDKEGNTHFEISATDMKEAEEHFRGGDNFYLLRYDVSDEIDAKARIKKLEDFCNVLTSKTEGGEPQSLLVFVSTVIEEDLACDFFELDETDLCPLEEQEDNESEEEVIEVSADELSDISALLEVAQEEINESIIEEPETVEEEKVRETPKTTQPQVSRNTEKSPTKTENLRVNVQLLEKLMTIAGELVLARNQLVQAVSIDDYESIKSSTHHINVVTSQLQEAVMKTRMQPIGKTFSKFNRIVRDLSTDLGKNVELIVEGDAVEIDKNIIESINDPLTHIVRNSMDHGLETPEERKASGKDPQGRLEIKAFQETGKVIIEINDDGRGIDPQKVGKKALEKGLITENDFNNMGQKELINLIFKPGFSTNEQVTEISGRGVGMDVVLTNLNEVGGVVDVNSKVGHGTNLRISLPLTLAIMPSLLVSYSETVYAIPQVNLVQIVRIPVAQINKQLQHIGDSLVIRFLDRLIPVVRAEDFLEEESAKIPFEEENFGFSRPLHVVVVAAGEFQYGIIVDQTLESPEVVVKALGRNLKPLQVYSGATILGDGTIAPILDIQGIMQEMNLNTFANIEEDNAADSMFRQSDLQKLLVINNGTDENYSLMLKNVLRVERISTDQIKHVGSTRSCEIDGKSIALFTVDDAADVKPLKIEGNLAVILFEVLGRQVGLLTKEIVDSLEVQVEFEEFPYKQPGIFGSTYINDKLCLLIDCFTLVSSQKPQWVNQSDIINEGKSDDHFNILVVEDSKFFQNQICTFLEDAGYNPISAENGEEALKILRDNNVVNIDLVLTDIEMPIMDGWELIKEIKHDSELNKLPVIALTSVSGTSAVAKGKSLGVNEYLIKLDREEIIMTLRKYLNSNVKFAVAG